MDPKQMAKLMIAFNKTSFDNNFRAWLAVHEQTERMVNKFQEKSPLFPEEGKKAVADWMHAYKKSCDDFKNRVDHNFKELEDFLNESK